MIKKDSTTDSGVGGRRSKSLYRKNLVAALVLVGGMTGGYFLRGMLGQVVVGTCWLLLLLLVAAMLHKLGS